MPYQFRGDNYPWTNRSGGTVAALQLIALTAGNAQAAQLEAVLAIADGSNRRADGITQIACPHNVSSFFRRDYILEGTAAANVNTAGAAVGDPVYLSPTVAGAWTLTKPNAAGQDVQEIGHVAVVHATLGVIHFKLQLGGCAGLAPDSISPHLLEQKAYANVGRASSATILFTGVTADGERIAINSRTYEFDVAGPWPTLGAGADVGVNVTGGNSAAQSATAFAAAVNGDASRAVDAQVDAAGTGVILVGRSATASTNYTLTTTGANITLPGATMDQDGAVPAATSMIDGGRVITAHDVTVLGTTLGTSEIVLDVFPSTSAPNLRLVEAWRVAGGVFDPLSIVGMGFRIVQANANYYALLLRENAAGAVLQANDQVAWQLIRPA